MENRNVHLIAIGGSAMHNLAIALHEKGYHVTGSDDEIFEPSKSRLASRGLLPDSEGWNADRIHEGLEAVIVGMHARKDNPELLRAQELQLRIFSYPEYVYEQTKAKRRVVIGGSHGKTSTTAMILHVLKQVGMEADFLVGAQLEGFDCMVRFSETSSVAVIEGDEYLSSPTDLRPKFHLYHPDIAVITGIAWDHVNVFPTFENYVDQFKIFTDRITPNGSLVYCAEDKEVERVALQSRPDIRRLPYGTHSHAIRDGITYLNTSEGEVALKIFGQHNLQNLEAAHGVCQQLGISDSNFYQAISSFTGAARRLELVKHTDHVDIYKDFAHSPSKLKATTSAFKSQFPNRPLVACMELHTFSSLNASFLNQYDGAMGAADIAFVYFNPKTIEHKKLPPISADQVRAAFGGNNVEVFTNSQLLQERLQAMDWHERNLLLMTSGNFDGVDFVQLADALTV
jgi:UDP-N-acetylmuramate: L-alanyl-gamma-D-glutamyl-meso-diaminopimelate ligase